MPTLTTLSPGGLKARPVFMLTEQFIRSLRVTNFKKPTLPPSTAACEEMNFSNLALKYVEAQYPYT